jgi:hypothetical protein
MEKLKGRIPSLFLWPSLKKEYKGCRPEFSAVVFIGFSPTSPRQLKNAARASSLLSRSVFLLSETVSKEKHGIWDPMLELIITSP